MPWTDHILLAFPVDLFSTPEETLEAINGLAYLIDPDVGGRETFALGQQVGGYFYTETQLLTSTYAMLSADTDTWLSAIQEKADAKGEPPIDPEIVKKLHDGFLYGDRAMSAMYG